MSLDLQLPVKVYLDDEILLLPLTSDSMTYEGLVDHLQRAFNEKLDPNSQLRIKYLDEDKEWVTITDTAVLIHALKDKTSMKIKVESLKSRPCPTNVANRIALELKPLSESVKNVIDRLTSIANSLEGTNQPPPETKLSNQLLGDLNSMTLLSSTTTTQHAHTQKTGDIAMYPEQNRHEMSKPLYSRPSSKQQYTERPPYPAGLQQTRPGLPPMGYDQNSTRPMQPSYSNPPMRTQGPSHGIRPTQISAMDTHRPILRPEQPQTYGNDISSEIIYTVQPPSQTHPQIQPPLYQNMPQPPTGRPQGSYPQGPPRPQFQQGYGQPIRQYSSQHGYPNDSNYPPQS